MFGIAAIVSFALALIIWLASIHQGRVLTWETFALAGLLCMAVHMVTGWWPRRGAQ
jgi:phosphoglycerol transferase MdoB-like AlkP superfamily enzyme